MSRKAWTDEKLFFRLLNNKSKKTYWDNVHELRLRPNENVFNTCIKLIRSSKSQECIVGIDVLAQLGSTSRPFLKESIKEFFDVLKRARNRNELIAALHAVGHNNYKLKSDEIAVLVSFKDNANEGVRRALVSSLLSVDNKLAIETLVYLSTDKSAHIRDWATFGIGSQIDRDNKLIREALWRRVNDQDQNTRMEAIVGLAKRKDKRIKKVIENELSKGEYGTLLFEAIEELNEKDFLPILRRHLRKAKREEGIDLSWLNDLKDCIKILESS